MLIDQACLQRKSPRLKNFNYKQPGAYFVTICAAHKACIFGKIHNNRSIPNQLGEIVQSQWTSLPAQFPSVELDFWILMPNHFHGILFLNDNNIHLSKIIGFFKMRSTSAIRKLLADNDRIVWQRNYYDHVLRDDLDLARVRMYISTNPEKWINDPFFPLQVKGGA